MTNNKRTDYLQKGAVHTGYKKMGRVVNEGERNCKTV